MLIFKSCGYHSSLRDMPEQLCCPLEHEWSSLTNSLWKLGLQILMPLIQMLLLLWPCPCYWNFLAVCPSHLSRHLSKWSCEVLVVEFSSHCKGSSFSSTKGVPPWLNFPLLQFRILFSVELIFVSVEDIKTRFVLVKWPGELMTASQLTLCAFFKTEVFGCLEISWHSWDPCFNCFSERAKIIISVFIKLRNSICSTGSRTDFLRLITIAKCCNRKINVSLSP